MLLLAIIGGFGYWYRETQSTCRVPILYDIGFIDERFNITREEVRTALLDAELLWERVTGKELFVHTSGSDFTIDFIFDERQQETLEEREFRNELDKQENVSESIYAEYESLTTQYDALKAAYEARAKVYENGLAEHNSNVEFWNEKGGAPPEEFDKLNLRQEKLSEEHRALNNISSDLNVLVERINAIGGEGNRAVNEYNQEVERYNDRFNQDREFTQGDYRGDSISIYQFDNETELRLVLAHEFGHALSLEHVSNPQSIMYHTMEGQLADMLLSSADLEEFNRVCGSRLN